MAKKLLLFALEYYGYHSVRGTALSKRARQISESFSTDGWEVTVIHKDQVNECGNDAFKIFNERERIKRISVKCEENFEDFEKNGFIRKIETLSYITFYGDRSHRWAINVIKYYNEFGISEQQDHIIALYQPRAPLHLGNYFSKKLNVPWIADLQDDVFRGIAKNTIFLSAIWMRRILKTAKAISQVSPEWAETDGKHLGYKINVIRHAIPDAIKMPEINVVPEQFSKNKGSFNIFYGGSLSPHIQSLDVLKKVLSYANSINLSFKIFIAGNESVYNHFCHELGSQHIIQLGWLSKDEMNKYIFNCNCTLVITTSVMSGWLPSKFYELCSYPKPIWIIGGDIDAFTSLLNEWKHNRILTGDFEYQKKALLEGVNSNYEYFFNLNNCKGEYLVAANLNKEYLKLMQRPI